MNWIDRLLTALWIVTLGQLPPEQEERIRWLCLRELRAREEEREQKQPQSWFAQQANYVRPPERRGIRPKRPLTFEDVMTHC